MGFFLDKSISAVKRQTYTGSKSALTTVTGLTAACYLEAMDSVMAAQSGLEWGKAFNVFTESGVNITESDMITIESVNYTVKGTQDWSRLSPSYRLLLVVKEESS